MNLVTVLTPSYNRAHTLGTLYNSLLSQTNLSFEWLIIDDGSTDNTAALVTQWIDSSNFTIRYYYKVNGGKHTALNYAYQYVKTELIFIVDSDDYLPPNAINIVCTYHSKYSNTPGLCGYSFLRFYPDKTVNTAYFSQDEKIESYLDARINGNIGGDKAEVFYTKILIQYPFPVYEHEKFVPEDLIWMQMSQKYNMVHINQCIYISDYLEDGLTKAGRKMKILSPLGMMERSLIYINSPKVRYSIVLKMMLLYIVYGKFANITIKQQLKTTGRKITFIFCYLPGYLIYHSWRKTYLRQEDLL